MTEVKGNMCTTTNAEKYCAIEVELRENDLSGGRRPFPANGCVRTEDPEVGTKDCIPKI